VTTAIRGCQTVVLAVSLSLTSLAARAAVLAGVDLPDHLTAAGVELTLNGAALRTATIFRLPVYVAGLYLKQPTHDAQQIVASPQPKLLRFVFLRNIGVDKVRNAWRQSLDRNCTTPCQLPDGEVSEFINRLPAVKTGETADVVFTPQGVDFAVNGHSLGWVTDPVFVRVILLGYVGPHASSPSVRNGILGKK